MAATGIDDGIGLMANWANIDPDYLTRYQQWLNCEHMPERVSIPGFLQGRRYRSIDASSHFLAFYETKTTSVLGSEAYMERLNSPTPWTLESLAAFQDNPIRNIYSRIAVAGKPGPFTAPYVITVRFDLAEAGEAVCAENWVKATAEDDKVERIRLYKQDSAIGNIQTSERKIYGAGPGEQVYLLLIEYAKPPESVSDLFERWDAALGSQAQRVNEQTGAYFLDMFHRMREAV
jgi:hypothetical protein